VTAAGAGAHAPRTTVRQVGVLAGAQKGAVYAVRQRQPGSRDRESAVAAPDPAPIRHAVRGVSPGESSPGARGGSPPARGGTAGHTPLAATRAGAPAPAAALSGATGRCPAREHTGSRPRLPAPDSPTVPRTGSCVTRGSRVWCNVPMVGVGYSSTPPGPGAGRYASGHTPTCLAREAADLVKQSTRIANHRRPGGRGETPSRRDRQAAGRVGGCTCPCARSPGRSGTGCIMRDRAGSGQLKRLPITNGPRSTRRRRPPECSPGPAG
jgi:hypothetical protein